MHEVGYWEGSIDNETPTNPVTLYGVAKDALRRASFATLSDQVELAWVRAFYIVGDDRQNHSVFTKLLAAADEGQSHFALTSGTNRYDFINVEELGRQIATVALAIGEVGVINCCSGVPVSLRERIDQFICNHGLSITPKYGAFPDRPYDSPSVWGDPSNIKRIMASFQAVEKTENR
jgi:dTDP-6-deoxy-L-talose 4-dehydrogenase (NAD+)